MCIRLLPKQDACLLPLQIYIPVPDSDAKNQYTSNGAALPHFTQKHVKSRRSMHIAPTFKSDTLNIYMRRSFTIPISVRSVGSNQ